jgi:hypothetical protein
VLEEPDRPEDATQVAKGEGKHEQRNYTLFRNYGLPPLFLIVSLAVLNSAGEGFALLTALSFISIIAIVGFIIGGFGLLFRSEPRRYVPHAFVSVVLCVIVVFALPKPKQGGRLQSSGAEDAIVLNSTPGGDALPELEPRTVSQSEEETEEREAWQERRALEPDDPRYWGGQTIQRLFTAVCSSREMLRFLLVQYRAGKFMEEHPDTAENCWIVDQGQRVNVISVEPGYRQIDILDGPKTGRAWILPEDLVP